MLFRAGQKFERKDGAILEIIRVWPDLIEGFGGQGVNQFQDTPEAFEQLIEEGYLKELV